MWTGPWRGVVLREKERSPAIPGLQPSQSDAATCTTLPVQDEQDSLSLSPRSRDELSPPSPARAAES